MPEAKRGYHHGNLREALVRATLELIEDKGPMGFTLSEAARRAGVSAAAPYRHFRGREELITEVARQGYEIFGELLENAYADGNPTALASFERIGRAYLTFATKNPGHYMAMFESGISINSSPELAALANRALSVIARSAQNLSRHLPPERRPPESMVSQHIWAMSHGVVELFTRGPPGARSAFSPEDLLETGIGIYLRGLGIIPMD